MSLLTTELDQVVEAAKVVENVVGKGWATDAEGKFIHVTREVLVRLGMTFAEFVESGTEGFPWEEIVHPDDRASAKSLWRKSLQSGEQYSFKHRMLRNAGVYGWVWCSGQPLRLAGGRVAGWYGTVIDIDIPQFHSEASEGPPSLSLIHPDDRAAAAHAAAYSFWTGVPQIVSCRQRQSDGEYLWTELRAEPGYCVGVDVAPSVSLQDEPWTEAESLGETAEAVRAATVIESLHGKAWAFDSEGRFTYVTPSAQKVIGMTLQTLNAPIRGGRFIDGGDVGWSRGVHPDDYQEAAASLRHSLKTGEPWNVEYRMLQTTGRYVWHRISARPTKDRMGRITGWYGTSIDVDVYKRTEAELLRQKLELSQLINMVPSHVWSLTPEGEPTFFNKQMVDYLGFDLSEAEKRGITGLEMILGSVHAEDAKDFRRTIDHCLATGKPFAFRYRLRRADGVYHWMSSRAEPIQGLDGDIIHWYGICHDIDDLLTTQEALQKSERHLWQLVGTLPAMIYCASPEGEPTYRSEKLRAFLGIELEETEQGGKSRLNKTLDAIIHPDDLPAVRENYARSLATGEPYVRKHRLKRFDGSYRWVETRAAAMRDDKGEIIQWNGICLDIDDQVKARNELRLMQERLARAAQTSSLAELSASIAHEVNQPLASVVANSHACQRWLRANPPNLDRAQITLTRILRDASSAAEVVSRIRALFKQSRKKWAQARIEDIIREAQRLMTDAAEDHKILIQTVIESDIPPIALDRIQIQQVLINLMKNGVEAMDVVSTHQTLLVGARHHGSEVLVQVSDNGHGVDDPERVFEPFFTTKEHGMGMGLAICRSIVEAHGGRMWAELNEMKGTTFSFTLPVTVTDI
ncbi:PAS domain-containing protein [Roseovarius sp. B08]|uniref:PAS domain-containing protein n=1 Tax=Roseovarius sp. B08 TaxID=3449223 RepID=UPI003EDC76D8